MTDVLRQLARDMVLAWRRHLPAEVRLPDPVQRRFQARTILASVWALADISERPGNDRPMPPGVPRYR